MYHCFFIIIDLFSQILYNKANLKKKEKKNILFLMKYDFKKLK